LSNQAWTKGLAWKHSDEFNAAEVHDWNGGAGLARSSNGFTFLQVKDGGHMVPSDLPEVSLTMLKTFLSGGEFELLQVDIKIYDRNTTNISRRRFLTSQCKYIVKASGGTPPGRLLGSTIHSRKKEGETDGFSSNNIHPQFWIVTYK
jgi:hypothetical protein